MAGFKAIILGLVWMVFHQLPLAQDKIDNSIPYPNRSIYLEEGLVGSLGFGLYNVLGEYTVKGQTYNHSSLFQWQGEGSFYYKPWISGGASSKIVAGEPTRSSAQVDSRYVLFTRLHKRLGPMAFFIGPTLGLHSLEFEADSTSPEDRPIQLSESYFKYGLEAGGGIRMGRALGLTYGTEVEHSLLRELLIRFNGGFSLSINYLWPQLAKSTKGFFLMWELQYAMLSDSRGPKREREYVLVVGSAVAF